MARKKKHEEHENHERWLVSYADFITLLFAFFVVMYSISQVNDGKYRVLAEALVAAFRANPKAMEPIQFDKPAKPDILDNRELNRPQSVAKPVSSPVALPLKTPATPKQGRLEENATEMHAGKAMTEIAEQVEKAMAPLIEKDLIHVRRFRFWLEIEIKTNILFPSGTAELQPAALPVLKSLAVILSEYPNPIHVEGFTDNVPIKTALYPSNWELSTARAMSVVHLFAREGLKPERLAAVGYSEFKPAAPNDTEEGRSKNRKVVLVVMADDNSSRLRDVDPSGVAPGATGKLPSSGATSSDQYSEKQEASPASAPSSAREADKFSGKAGPPVPGR